MNTGNPFSRSFEGSARGFRFAVVVSRFNEQVTARLLDGALECLREYGASGKDVHVFPCPGAFELPQVANKLAAQKRWDAIICLGAVIRGETPHFEYVAGETARGIQEVALRTSVPVVLGVLTTNTAKQALDRAGGKRGNKGRDAAIAAMDMASTFKKLRGKGK